MEAWTFRLAKGLDLAFPRPEPSSTTGLGWCPVRVAEGWSGYNLRALSLAATVAAAEAARGEAASELVGDLGSFLLLGSTFLSTAGHCLHYFS